MTALDARLRDAVAGGTAGLATVLALHPLDVVKTRLQVQDGRGGRDGYAGTVHALRTIARAEGWRGLYAGLAPALVGGTVAWGVYFACYNGAKAQLAERLGAPLPPWAHLGAAALSGCTVSLLTNPVWVAKTRLQLQRAGSPGPAPYRGLADCLARVAREEGPRGLYRGLLPSLALVSHGALQFAAYEALRARLEAPEQPLGAAQAAACGTAAKLAASAATYPSQVLRSRLQRRSPAPAGLGATARALLARSGVRGLYQGFVPNVLRVLPGAALTFVVYERMAAALSPQRQS